MTDPNPQSDAAAFAYEAAQARLMDLINNPEKHLPVDEYRAHLDDALKAKQRAYKKMTEARA